MIAEELINHMIPPLKLSDDAHKAMVWMEEFRCHQLPVVDQGKFLGFVSEEILLENNDIEKKLTDISLMGKKGHVHLSCHFFEILKIASDEKLQLLAVIDDDGNYCGVISIQDTLSSFAQTAAVQFPGGILVLSLDFHDYSLSEISRLIEENHGKILSSMVKEDPENPGKIRLTLKINQVDLSRIIATLERFGYKVIGLYQEAKPSGNDQDRIDMLLRYLDI